MTKQKELKRSYEKKGKRKQMVLISHRGNITHPIPEEENRPYYIQKALDQGYHVEIDVRYIDNELYLGHDGPDYLVDLVWLMNRKDKLWIHTKNFAALDYLIRYNLQVFYHQLEDHTIIGNSKVEWANRNVLWSHNIKEASDCSIIPLISNEDIDNHLMHIDDELYEFDHYYGICSDYVARIKSY